MDDLQRTRRRSVADILTGMQGLRPPTLRAARLAQVRHQDPAATVPTVTHHVPCRRFLPLFISRGGRLYDQYYPYFPIVSAITLLS